MEAEDRIYKQAQAMVELSLLHLFMDGSLSADGLRQAVQCVRDAPPPTDEQAAIEIRADFQALVAAGNATGDPLGFLSQFATESVRETTRRGGDNAP